MDEALHRVEARPIAQMDVELLRIAARVYRDIGPQLLKAFEGEQRTKLKEVFAYVRENHIQPAPDAPPKADLLSNIVLGVIIVLLGFIVVKIASQWPAMKRRRLHTHGTKLSSSATEQGSLSSLRSSAFTFLRNNMFHGPIYPTTSTAMSSLPPSTSH